MSRRPKWLIIASNIKHNLIARWNLSRGKLDSDIGSTHSKLSTQQSVDYICRVFDDYLAYGELSADSLTGLRILEIGPGDNLGVALRFYAAGAEKVVCLDKFFSHRDASQQKAIYAALRERVPEDQRARYDQALNLATGEINAECVQYSYGAPAEQADSVVGRGAFDLIVSRAVMWEIYDIEAALRALDRTLKPGGRVIHKITCLDWMFRENGHHPLEFLTIPEPIYRWMARDSGKSNRRNIDFYRRFMRQLGYDTQFHITKVVGTAVPEFPPGVAELKRDVHYTQREIDAIAMIRPRLLPRFKALPDHDLLVEDMFVIGAKPGAVSRQAMA